MNISEFRQKYPQYDNVEDRELADRFYGKYYTHVPREEFDRAFLGIEPEPVDNAGPVKKFLTRDIPNIGRTFGDRIWAGYQESAGGGIQMAGEGRESVRQATIYSDLDPTNRDDIQTFLKSSVPSDRQEFARIRKEFINAGETPEMAESIALSEVKKRASGAPSVYGSESSNQAIADYGKQKSAEGRQLRQYLAEEEPLETKGGELTAGAIESIGQMAPSLIAGAVTGNPAVALAGMGGMTAGQAYGQSRSEGMSQEDAMKNALVQGAAESATELLPLYRLAALFKPGRLGKKAIDYIISEVPSEMLATAIQNSSDVAFSNNPEDRVKEIKNYLSSKQFVQDEVDTVLQTLIQGGIMTGAGGLTGATRRRLTREPQIDKTKESNLGEIAEATTPEPVDDSGQLGDEIPGAPDYDPVQMGLDEGQYGEVVKPKQKEGVVNPETIERPLNRHLPATQPYAEPVYGEQVDSVPTTAIPLRQGPSQRDVSGALPMPQSRRLSRTPNIATETGVLPSDQYSQIRNTRPQQGMTEQEVAESQAVVGDDPDARLKVLNKRIANLSKIKKRSDVQQKNLDAVMEEKDAIEESFEQPEMVPDYPVISEGTREGQNETPQENDKETQQETQSPQAAAIKKLTDGRRKQPDIFTVSDPAAKMDGYVFVDDGKTLKIAKPNGKIEKASPFISRRVEKLYAEGKTQPYQENTDNDVPEVSSPGTEAREEMPQVRTPRVIDPRLNRKEYKENLNEFVASQSFNEAEQGRVGSTIVDDSGQVFGKVASANPGWVQEASGMVGGVDKLRNAVKKAVNGEKLGKNQEAAVLVALDEYRKQRVDAQIEDRKDLLQRLRAERSEAQPQQVPPINDDYLEADLYDSADYGELSEQGRFIHDIAYKVEQIIGKDATLEILDSNREDSEIASELYRILGEGNNGRAGQESRTDDAGTQTEAGQEDGQNTYAESNQSAKAGDDLKLFATPSTFGKKPIPQNAENVNSLDFTLPEEELGLFDDPEKDGRVHDFSSTQIALPEEQADKIIAFGQKIPDSELYTDPEDPSYGRETEPHVTVRYGLETDDPKAIEGLSELPPITATMGDVSIFENDKYDVVKVDIEGDSLRAANKKVGELVDLPGETFTDYKPHATIAYVKKGEGQKYVGNKTFNGEEVTVDEIELVDRNGNSHTIELSGEREVEPESPTNQPTSAPKASDAIEAGQSQRSESATNQQEKIEDFGEVLIGARKHYAATLSDAEKLDTATVPLSKAWPEPSYQDLLDKGFDPYVVAMVRTMRDSIPTKGRSGWKVKQYVKSVEMLRGLAKDLLSGEVSKKQFQEQLNKDEYKNLKEQLKSTADLYQAVGHKHSLKGIKISVGRYSVYNGEHFDTPKTIWSVEKKAKATAFSNWPKQFAIGDTRQEAIDNFKKKADSILEGENKKSKGTKFVIWRDSLQGKYFVGKKFSSRRYLELEGFDDLADARKYLNENQDKLEAKLEKIKKLPQERKSENAPRVGEDHLKGVDVNPEMFSEQFGFRGVQFGNYVDQRKRQSDLNEAYDALMDMAGVLNVPPKALSLNGELGLAFGARGHGGKDAPSAHYEPDTIVINLTKRSGAGSLAHEWWHALDNYFNRGRKESGFITENPRRRDKYVNREKVEDPTRQEMLDAFKGVMDAIAQTDLPQRSRKADQAKSKTYYSDPVEMSARAFENFIIEKLNDNNGSNDYLANIVSQDYWDAAAKLGLNQENSYPYLTEDEKKSVVPAYQNLFDTIESKETSDGVALYSRAEQDYEVSGFTDQINKTLSGEIPRVQPLVVGKTPEIYQAVGFESLPLVMGRSVLDKIYSGKDGLRNKVSLDNLRRLPAYLKDPAAIFQSKQREDSIVVVTDMIDNGGNVVVVAIAKDKEAGRFKVNLVSSAYGKDRLSQFAMREAQEGRLLYLRKNESPASDVTSRLQLPGVRGQKQGYIERILNRLKPVKHRSQYSLRTDLNKQLKDDITGMRERVEYLEKEFGQKSTVDQVENELKNFLGVGHNRLKQLGKLKVFQAVEDLTAETGETLKTESGSPVGIYQNGQITLVADAIQSGDAEYVMRHEGLHQLFAEDPIFKKKRSDILGQFERMRKSNKKVQAAFDRVPEDTRSGYETEEALAYFVQDKNNHNHTLFRKIVATVKDWMMRVGIPVKNFTPADLAYIITKNVKRFAKRPSMESQQGDPLFSVLKKADESLEKLENKVHKAPDVYRENFGYNTTLGSIRETLRAMRGADINWRQALLDRYDPIKTMLGQDAYRAHRLLGNHGNVLVTWLEHGNIKLDGGAPTVTGRKNGFLPWFESLGQEDGRKMLAWIAVKRAEQLEREGRENWLTKGKRQELMNWIGDSQNWSELNKQFQAYNKEILDLAEESGLISKEGRQAWESDIYIPFYREDGLYDEDILHPQKSKRHVSAQIKRLKGGEMKINDLLENTLRNWGHLIQESQRNIARKRAVDVGTELGIIEEADKRELYLQSKAARKENFVISYSEGGEQVFVKVNDPGLFNALSEINLEFFSGPVMKALGFAKRTLTYGATFGPAFRVANAFRDTLHTAVISESFAPFIDTYKGMIQVMRKSDDYIALMGSGGGFGQGYLDANDPRAMSRQIKKIAKREGEGAIGRIIDTPRKLLELWEHIGHISEMAARTQLYTNLKKKGKSHEEAAFQARDILDFGLSGDAAIVRGAIATIPFLNARFQGLDRMYRGAKADPKAFAIKGTIVALASLGLWAMFKDDERYKELEDWEKWSYHHFWIGDLHYRLPKAFEVGAIFSTLPEALADVVSGNEEADYFSDFLLHTATETFSLSYPAAISPGLEVFANKSFFKGRPIEDLGDSKKPPGLRYEPWTSETLKAIGEKYNISPKKMETLIQGHFGALGMFLLGGSDFAIGLFSEVERPAKKIDQYMLIGRFIREGGGSRSKYATRLYETFREIDELSATVSHYKNSGDLDLARQAVRENRELWSMRKFKNNVQKRLNNLRKRERDIWAMDISAEKKRQKLDELAEKKREIYQKAYEKVEQKR